MTPLIAIREGRRIPIRWLSSRRGTVRVIKLTGTGRKTGQVFRPYRKRGARVRWEPMAPGIPLLRQTGGRSQPELS